MGSHPGQAQSQSHGSTRDPCDPGEKEQINAHVLRRIPIEDTATSNPDHLRQVPFADHLNIIAAMIGELHTPMEF